MAVSEKHLIWLDCEMTGLDPDSERIIEIATIVTDSQLSIVAEGPSIVVNQPDDLLDNMDDWNTKQHSESGLIDRVRKSTVTEKEAEQQMLAFLKQYVPPGVSPLCGNSIHQDRRFLERYMPDLNNFFHYRNLDVSTIKILAERWAFYLLGGIDKQSKHLALEDVKESINELKYYREYFFSFVHDPINR